jgi:hypothetical protein
MERFDHKQRRFGALAHFQLEGCVRRHALAITGKTLGRTN